MEGRKKQIYTNSPPKLSLSQYDVPNYNTNRPFVHLSWKVYGIRMEDETLRHTETREVGRYCRLTTERPPTLVPPNERLTKENPGGFLLEGRNVKEEINLWRSLGYCKGSTSDTLGDPVSGVKSLSVTRDLRYIKWFYPQLSTTDCESFQFISPFL